MKELPPIWRREERNSIATDQRLADFAEEPLLNARAHIYNSLHRIEERLIVSHRMVMW